MATSYRIRTAVVWPALTPCYDFGCGLLGFGRPFRDWILDGAQVDAEARVLDVGCGTGVLLARLAERGLGGSLVGVDADPGALARAKARSHRGGHDVAFHVARGESLPFAAGSFHRVLSSLALHHVPDFAKGDLLAEIHRVLAPGGEFILADFDNYRRRWVPRWFRSARRLPVWLLEAGFDARPIGRRRLVQLYRCRVQASDSSGVIHKFV